MRKIYILTQPLGYNYGGILQNYALQQILFQMGCSPCTVMTDLILKDFIVDYCKLFLQISHNFFYLDKKENPCYLLLYDKRKVKTWILKNIIWWYLVKLSSTSRKN